ncbi:MAG: Panacea domain-containing protein [bacterium]
MNNNLCENLAQSENITFPFEEKIAEETILYVTNTIEIKDIYRVLKVIYFASRFHLERYGRLIYGESFTALQHGPVPQGAYNLIKKYRKENTQDKTEYPVAICGNDIKALRKADLDFFSESEIECLDEAIKKYGHLSFGDIKKISHTSAYNKADENDYMKIEDIIAEFENGNILLKHLQNPFPDREDDNDISLPR